MEQCLGIGYQSLEVGEQLRRINWLFGSFVHWVCGG
jgi:hypothetical protein